jgi:hypothetical protein
VTRHAACNETLHVQHLTMERLVMWRPLVTLPVLDCSMALKLVQYCSSS